MGRPARLGFVDCSGGFGLVGVLEELLAFAPASAFGSAFEFFSDDTEMESPLFDANRLSGRVCCCLGTEINRHKIKSAAAQKAPGTVVWKIPPQASTCIAMCKRIPNVLFKITASKASKPAISDMR